MMVPASVPSEVQICLPCTPSSAVKNSLPPATMKFCGFEPVAPMTMSFTRCVASVVVSVTHSSWP
jgi:hypothetical protein